MSHWFGAYVRRGGRVHRDGLSPRLVSHMRREAHARAMRRRAFELGQRSSGKVLFAILALAALYLVFRHLWEL